MQKCGDFMSSAYGQNKKHSKNTKKMQLLILKAVNKFGSLRNEKIVCFLGSFVSA